MCIYGITYDHLFFIYTWDNRWQPSDNQAIVILVGGKQTPLKNMKVNWDDYSQYMGK